MPHYVHFTNSAILPGLELTDFKFVSVEKMLYTYGFAPMSGEIFGGGLVGAFNSLSLRFAEVGSPQWPWDRLLTNYGKRQNENLYFVTRVELDKFLEEKINWNTAWQSLKEICIKWLRDQQQNHFIKSTDLAHIQEFENQLEKDITAFIQFCNASYAFCKFVRRSSKDKFPHSFAPDPALDEFLVKEFPGLLPLNFIDLDDQSQKSIVSEIISQSIYAEDFTILERLEPKDYQGSPFGLAVKNFSPDGTSLADFLYDVDKYWVHFENKSPDPAKILAEIRRNLAIITQIKALYEQVKQQSLSSEARIRLTESDRPFYPIAILLQDNSTAELKPLKAEFDTKKELRMGEDIKMLLTDSHEHVQSLNEYIDKNNIQYMTVMTFDDYKNMQAPLASQPHSLGNRYPVFQAAVPQKQATPPSATPKFY